MGAVDNAHAARANLFEDSVMLKNLPNHGLMSSAILVETGCVGNWVHGQK